MRPIWATLVSLRWTTGSTTTTRPARWSVNWGGRDVRRSPASPSTDRFLSVVPVMDAVNSFGGPTSVAMSLLGAPGLRPSFLISAYPRRTGPFTEPVDAVHRQFPGINLRSGKPGTLVSLRFAIGLLRGTLAATAVIVHGLREPHAALAALLAVAVRRPFVILAHGMTTAALASPSLYTRCCLALASRARQVYALTEGEKTALSRHVAAGRVS